MMQVWEYHTIQSWKQGTNFHWSSSQDGFLNDMGQKGWELVSVVERERNMVEWIFKRPKESAISIVNAGRLEEAACVA